MQTRRISTAVAVLCFGIAEMPAALAQESGFYLGAHYGITRSSVEATQAASYTNPCLSASCSTDDSDQGFGLFGGYRFNRHVAVEGAFVDLGDTAAINTSGAGGSSSTKQGTNGLRVVVVGSLPLKHGFTLFGKAGVYRWTSDVSFSNTLGASYSASESGFAPSLGLGVRYALNKQVALQLAWDRYQKLGDSSGALQSATGPVKTIDVDADLISLGVRYDFR